MLYYHENGNIPLNTPRKDGIVEREGGREMEMLLFGRIIKQMNIKEALYILNENNYNKNIFQFKEDFEQLFKENEKKEDFKVTGEFSEYNLPDNILGPSSQFFMSIKTEASEQNMFIESFDYH